MNIFSHGGYKNESRSETTAVNPGRKRRLLVLRKKEFKKKIGLFFNYYMIQEMPLYYEEKEVTQNVCDSKTKKLCG